MSELRPQVTAAAPALGAWRCSGESNDELVGNLVASGILKSEGLAAKAMAATDRASYVPRDVPNYQKRKSTRYHYGPYADAPQSIGYKVTISAPYIHATALETLSACIRLPNSRILDVGSGSGVLVAYMSRMASNTSVIVGLEVIRELVDFSMDNLRRDGVEVDPDLNSDVGPTVVIRHGDGWVGAPDLGPFDAIHVGAFARNIPKALISQLKPGGRMVIPLGSENKQSFVCIDKLANGELATHDVCPIRFVPLVRKSAPGAVDYDKRYKKGWAYGKNPNEFLVTATQRFFPENKGNVPPKRVLCLGAGQGRNAVFLASQGYCCTAVDASSVGLTKALRLADQRGLPSDCIDTRIVDLRKFDPGAEGGKWDAIISIFCALDPRDRRCLHRACAAALAPGGLFVVECFGPGQEKLRGRRAG